MKAAASQQRVELCTGQRGDSVFIPIPPVDRGRGDPRNILGVVLDRSVSDIYTIATKSGILKGCYSRNEFDLCPKKLLEMVHIDCEKHVSLREAVILPRSLMPRGSPQKVHLLCRGPKCPTQVGH